MGYKLDDLCQIGIAMTALVEAAGRRKPITYGTSASRRTTCTGND
jgi:hypothetical protein